MEVSYFKENVLSKCKNVVDEGIKNGFFEEKDRDRLNNTLELLFSKEIKTDIEGDAIYGCYRPETKTLEFNVKVFKDEEEALIYTLHEIKHGLDDVDGRIGFQMQDNRGVGRNEGVTQRFATNMAEILMGKEILEKEQTCMGVTLNTNLDEYQLEDKINSLFCEALGISETDFIKMQNAEDLTSFEELKTKFNEYADFDVFNNALDEIYYIQAETWFDEQNEFLEKEKEASPEQIQRIQNCIQTCQQHILAYVLNARPEISEDIKARMIHFEGQVLSFLLMAGGVLKILEENNKYETEEKNDIGEMTYNEMRYQKDYSEYLDFIKQGLNLEDEEIVYASGLEEYPFDLEDTNLKLLLENGDKKEVILYLRKGDEYLRKEITIDKNGVSNVSESEKLQNAGEIIEGIEVTEVLAAPEEYIRFLRYIGYEENAKKIQAKYQYYLENIDKLEELQEKTPTDNSIADMMDYMRALITEDNIEDFSNQPENISQADEAFNALKKASIDDKQQNNNVPFPQ